MLIMMMMMTTTKIDPLIRMYDLDRNVVIQEDEENITLVQLMKRYRDLDEKLADFEDIERVL